VIDRTCSVLAACETMGNATTICSDKTGTLTKNRMTVVRAYAGKTDFQQAKEVKSLPASVVDNIALGTAVNSQYKSLYTIDAATNLPNQQGNKVRADC
jgi:P-type E1-E2 ATPase